MNYWYKGKYFEVHTLQKLILAALGSCGGKHSQEQCPLNFLYSESFAITHRLIKKKKQPHNY